MAYDWTWMHWPSHGWPKLRAFLAEVFDTSSGHDHDGSNAKKVDPVDLAGVSANVTAANLNDLTDGTDSTLHTHLLAQGATDVGTTEAELDQALDGISANVTAANLTALTGAGNTALHKHILANGGSDVTATVAEVNGVCDEQTLTAGTGGWTAKRFVGSNLQAAAIDSLLVVGVAPSTVAEAATGVLQSGGFHAVVADAPLSAADNAKVGVGGRVTKHTTAQTTLQGVITGEATAFTQPGVASTLEILQAADVAADRGRGIVIEGSNAGGTAITETITLDAANTTTPVAGATSFTKVSGVYTADGNALGAQNVTVRISPAGAGVCTLAGATSELGADIPSGTIQAYCNEATLTGPNADATFITLVGIDAATDAAARQRLQLNGASPSTVTSTTVWRVVNRVCLGEFTNAGTGSAKTNATTDTAAMKCGVVLVAAAARGNDAVVLIKPNA